MRLPALRTLALAVMLATPAVAQQKLTAAQLAPAWEKIKIGQYLESIKIGGDIRLRYDHSMKRGTPLTAADSNAVGNDRGRSRFRVRLASEFVFDHGFSALLRLASGTGEQVSTNQSADNLSNQKAIWIDQAFAKWAPNVSENGSVYLQGGRMQNPLWRVNSSDIVWDDDFNPEGYAQGVEWLLPGAGLTVFANALQAVADEDSNSSKNQWIFSQQIGAETRLPFETRLRVAGAYHKWSDEQRSSLGSGTGNVANNGNRRSANTAAGVLINRFGVGELTAQLSGWAGKLPLALQGTAIRNFRDRTDLGAVAGACPSGECAHANTGYQFGAIVGAAKNAGSWEAAYFKKWSETDATVADVSDSDFGDGGTNRQGHIFWVAYSPRDWAQLKAKYFITDTLDRQFFPNDKAVNRAQFDLSVKF